MRLKIIAATGMTVLLGSAYADPMINPNAMSVYSSAPEEGFLFTLDESLTSDSNVFRLPDGVYPPNASKRSDTINTQQADLSYNKFYGLQSITLDASLSHNTFNNFSYLDYNATRYNGMWAWRVSKDLSGTVGANQSQSLTNFAYFQSFTRNVYTTQSKYFNGDWWVTGPWHALFGISQNQASYSAVVLEQQSSRGNSTNAGMSYVSEAQNSISLKAQNTSGTLYGQPLNYFVLIDNGYTEKDILLDANWMLTGKSTLTGELKHFSVVHDHFTQRDYSGMGGSINYIWQWTGKVMVNFTAQRNFAQFLTAYSSYYVSDDFAITPMWQITPKVTLRMTYDHAKYSYLGSIVPIPGIDLSNVTQTVMMAADWAPTRKITLSTSLQHTTRNAGLLLYQYVDTSLNVIAQISF